MQKPAHVDFGFWISDFGFVFCGSPHASKGEKLDAELDQLPHNFVYFRVFSWLQEKKSEPRKTLNNTKTARVRAFEKRMFALRAHCRQVACGPAAASVPTAACGPAI
jgi:hypothetical protein